MFIRRLAAFAVLISLGFDLNSIRGDEMLQSIRPVAETGAAAAVITNAPRLLITRQILSTDGQGLLIGPGDSTKQIEQVFQNLTEILAASGVDFKRVAKLNFYVGRDDLVPEVKLALAKRFELPNLPAVSFVTTRLPSPGALIAVDAIGVLDGSAGENGLLGPAPLRQLPISVLNTKTMFFISGQAENAKDLATATRLTLLSLEASLKFCGREKRSIRQIKCFLTPMSQVQDVEREIHLFYDRGSIPPVTYVEWQSTLPIEIEVIADGMPDEGLKPDGSLVYLAPPGLPASPVFSRICRVHDRPVIFVSGLYGEANSSGTQQVESIFRELESILKESGSDLRHLVKATYYVSQDEPSQKLNELRPRYYDPKSPPAASKAQVSAVGKVGTGLTVDMIAVPASR